MDACKARDALDGTLFRGQPLRIQCTRTTTRVLVRGLPKAPPHDDKAWESHLKDAFPRAVHIERDGFWGGGDDYAVLFKRLSDAEDAVAEQCVVQGHVLSYDFGNDRQARTQRNNVSNNQDGERRRTPKPISQPEPKPWSFSCSVQITGTGSLAKQLPTVGESRAR